MAKQSQRYCRARFGICVGIGQIVRYGETLAEPTGTDAARYVQFFVCNVAIKRAAGIDKLLVAGDPAHVRHGGIQVQRAHSMPRRLPLHTHGHMRLIVSPVCKGVDFLLAHATLVKKEFCQRKIPFFTRVQVQPHEGKLYFGMSAGGKACVAAHVETQIDIVGILAHCRKQPPVYAANVQRNCRLDKVSCAVQLVFGAPSKNFVRLVHLKVTVEVAARQLIFHYGVHRFVNNAAHLLVGKFPL